MSGPVKLAAFALVLGLLFGAGALAGDLVGPERETAAIAADAPAAQEHTDMAAAAGKAAARHGGADETEHPVRGLAVAEDGLRLVAEDPELRRGRVERIALRIVDASGATVRDFDVAHEKRMHLIVARRDLTGFQHLHPEQAADGIWTAQVRLEDAGSYRLFADFSFDGEPYTLASDLRVDGTADLRPLPASEPTAVSDGGYRVRLDAGRARPGQQAELRFTITKHGRTIRTERYLGAGGHLVALREGDLAFLHVHPTEHGHGDERKAADRHDDAVSFAATFPTEGRYRLFLQFQHEGRIRTVSFTQEVR